MTVKCIGMTMMLGNDIEDAVFQKIEQLTNIRREGEKLVITAGGEELVMERAAREAVTAVPCMGNEQGCPRPK